MQFEHFKALIRSLRFRLAAWNTAVVLFAVVLTLFALREALRLTLLHETDQVLLDDAREVALTIEQLYPNLSDAFREMNRKVLGHVDRQLFLAVLDENGRTIYTSGHRPALGDLKAWDGLTPKSIGGFRLAGRELESRKVPHFQVRVGSSLAMISHDLDKLTRLMVGVGAIIVIIAPLGGYWLAGRATQPLARLIATTARLRPTRLEERLPTRGTGDELDRLSTTINRFLDLIAEYLDRNREFVANAAHELRSPLAAIQSSVEVALNSARSIDEYEELLSEISSQCSHLGALVNQLLVLAETDSTRFQIRKGPVRLDLLVERSIDMFRGAAEERGIHLAAEYGKPIVIDAEGNRIRQVINNLIDNSLKFTGPDGTVRITICQDVETNSVVLRVADDGIGIPAADLPHVFDRFFRGDRSRARQADAQGSGLGLSICWSIVTAHGGTMSAESSPGHGATFTMRLPNGSSPSIAQPQAAQVSSAVSPQLLRSERAT